jgi:hypothetical protein
MLDERKFHELYQRQKESGLSVRDFCSNELIAPSTFYYWQKKLKTSRRLPGFIPVVVDSQSPSQYLTHKEQGVLTPNKKGADKRDFLFEFEYPNGMQVRVTREVDYSVLRALIHLCD